MNGFDFSEVGRFPVTQENLSHLQEATKDMFKWIGLNDVSLLGAIILSGVRDDGMGGYTDGWVYVDGEILPYTDGQNGCQIIEQRDNVEFDGGALKDVKLTRWIGAAMGTPPLRVDQMRRIEEFFGKRAIGGWTNVAGTYGSGRNISIDYRINWLTRLLHIKGTLTVASASTLPDPTLYTSGGVMLPVTLPYKVPFRMFQRYHNIAVGSEVKSINAEITTGGEVVVGMIKNAADYNLEFNTIISLD